MDNKATCTSFGDENIFKAGWGTSVIMWRAFEEHLHRFKRKRRSGFDVDQKNLKKNWKKHSWDKLQQYFGFKVQEM